MSCGKWACFWFKVYLCVVKVRLWGIWGAAKFSRSWMQITTSRLRINNHTLETHFWSESLANCFPEFRECSLIYSATRLTRNRQDGHRRGFKASNSFLEARNTFLHAGLIATARRTPRIVHTLRRRVEEYWAGLFAHSDDYTTRDCHLFSQVDYDAATSAKQHKSLVVWALGISCHASWVAFQLNIQHPCLSL